MSRLLSRLAASPYAVLLLEVLLFYRKVLFAPKSYVIPWDLRYYHLPLAEFMAKCFRDGHLPLWDPWTYCGMPFHAIITTQVFYPPTVAAVLLSNWTGGKRLLYCLEWQAAGHVFLAGVFVYWLLRRLGAGHAPSLVGATVYQLGPFFTSQIQHIGAIDAAAWMPLAFLALVSLAERFSWRWLALLSVALAMTILAGFPAVTATAFAGCLLLCAALLLLRRARLHLAVSLAAGCAGSAALAGVQLFPTLELIRNSVARYRADWLGDGGGYPIQSLISLLLPNYYGIFQFDSMTWRLPWNPTWLYLYCGIAGLISIAAALAWFRNRNAIVFSLLTICALLWMLGENTPVGLTVFRLLPYAIKAPLYAEYAMPLFALGMAVLAGLGAQRLTGPRSAMIQGVLVAITALDLIAVGSGVKINTHRLDDEPGVAYEHIDGYREIPETMRKLVNQTSPPARIDTLNGSINWSGDAALLQVPTANGNDPLALERLMQVRLSFCQGERWGRWYQISNLESPLIDLLNVRYVVSREPIDPVLLRRARFVKAAELPGQVVYENSEVMPRFHLVNGVRPATNLESALAQLRSPDFDPRQEAVVEGLPEMALGSGPGAVRVVKYSPLEVVLEVDAAASAYLVTSETHYSGWRAWVDSAEQPIYYTNAAFRGLPVPGGRHTVVLRFSPGVLWRSAALSAASWLLLCALSLRSWTSPHRSKHPQTSSAR